MKIFFTIILIGFMILGCRDTVGPEEVNLPQLISEENTLIIILSPLEGETYYAGELVLIRWEFRDRSFERVSIELYKDVSQQSLIGVEGSLSSYAWSIPENLTESESYRIRIKGVSDSTIDVFSGEFTITNN